MKSLLAGAVVTVAIMVGAALFGYSSEKVLGVLILIGILLAGSLSGIFSGGERQRPWNKWSNDDMSRTINQGLMAFVFTLPLILGFFINYLLVIK
ncbi:hypothetical protein [uncultured Vagococcus sp.]|uniref:hypothetical protein n=1 Tax=uncultured Vagococcus sp. TaxID=189676 RepID=UPI0028D63DA8|nr:hypothetical protein [uncultured Vagococcus sp.]